MSSSGIMGQDNTAVVAAGATATVVLVSGLVYYFTSKPDSPPSRTSGEKKESKSKTKKKSSNKKKAQVKKAEPVPEPEPEVVEEAEEVEEEEEATPQQPPPPPPRRRKKGKAAKVAAPAAVPPEPAPPAPAPAVVEPEPTPEPTPAPAPATAAGGKKAKKRKNKAAKGGGGAGAGSAAAAADDSALLALAAAAAAEEGAAAAAAAEEAAAWTTVKTKRLPKSVAAAAAAAQPEFVSVADLEAGRVGAAAVDGGSASPAVPHVALDLGVFVSVVIGKSGATIKDITEKSGANIKVGGKKGEADAGSSMCVITGDEEAVATAEALIREILEREQAIKDKTVEITIEVGSKMPAVMGKQGANIKKIVQDSGATIDRIASSDSLAISGFAEQVGAAKALVELYMSGGPPPEAREEVELGSERARFVVLGPKGATVRQLQDDTGARVLLEHGKSYAVVEGDAEQVASAVALLKTLLDENSVCERIDAKNSRGGRSHIPALIGKGGSVIKGLREASGAAIDLVSGAEEVKVTGTRGQVAKAKAAILAIIAEEEVPAYAKLGKGEVCEELTMPLAAVGMVIGRMGLQIKQIKDESGANVLVPKVKDPGSGEGEGEEPTTTAKVFGPAAGVAKALAMLKEIVQRHEERAARDKANGKKPRNGGGGGGDGSNNGGAAKDGDAANPAKDEAEISFEVALDKDDAAVTAPADADAAGGWDAGASSPPGIDAAPGWS